MRIPGAKIVAVLAIALFAISCADDDDAAVDDGASLVGVWTGTEIGNETESWTFTFDASDGTAVSETEDYAFTYTTNPDEDPNQIDMTFTESWFPPYRGETAPLIYLLDGDALTLSSGEPGTDNRPTDFVNSYSANRVWELTRQ